MSRINTNIEAIRAVTQMQRNQGDLALRLERLATGLRINRGRDDPAGLIVSERLRNEAKGLEQAIANGARAANVLATAEGAMSEVSDLLLELQHLIVASANKSGLSSEEITANQLEVDSILDSINRIADTTTFAGQRLINGDMAYTLSDIPTNSIAAVSVFAARSIRSATRNIAIEVTQSAETAQVSFVGTNATGTSTTSATSIELRGNLGTDVLTFASGTTLADIRTSINNITGVTGVSAVVSSVAAGTGASALLLNSVEYGSDAFVSVEPLLGNFVRNDNAYVVTRDNGVDVGLLVNGQVTASQGLRADVRTIDLDARFHLTAAFSQSLSSANFTITGGGALFQLTPEVSPNGQTYMGVNSVRTTQLGDHVTGLLHTLRSGEGNDLFSENFVTAQEILDIAIDQVSSSRGRIGNMQRNTIDTAINSQEVAFENVTASESVIRDADMAVELSALTRAQILVQSTQSVLQIADSVPRNVLSLLS